MRALIDASALVMVVIFAVAVTVFSIVAVVQATAVLQRDITGAGDGISLDSLDDCDLVAPAPCF